jgi:hypothetical protein
MLLDQMRGYDAVLDDQFTRLRPWQNHLGNAFHEIATGRKSL